MTYDVDVYLYKEFLEEGLKGIMISQAAPPSWQYLTRNDIIIDSERRLRAIMEQIWSGEGFYIHQTPQEPALTSIQLELFHMNAFTTAD